MIFHGLTLLLASTVYTDYNKIQRFLSSNLKRESLHMIKSFIIMNIFLEQSNAINVLKLVHYVFHRIIIFIIIR